MTDPNAFKVNEFNTGLCDCCQDSDSCWEGCCCPWCMTAQSFNMIDRNQPTMDRAMCWGTLLLDLFVCAGNAHSCAEVVTRQKVRSHFRIAQGGNCCECLKAFCCSWCSACQVHRELSIRSMWPGGICVSTPFSKPGLVLPPQFEMQRK